MTRRERLRERRARHRQRSIVVRVGVAVAGFATLTTGVVLLVLPGPGIPLIVVGLGLLALEFRWAEVPLAYALRKAERVAPAKRWQRVVGGAAVLAAMATFLVAALLWGLPGF